MKDLEHTSWDALLHVSLSLDSIVQVELVSQLLQSQLFVEMESEQEQKHVMMETWQVMMVAHQPV